ncbi:adenylyl-sulfate kinase [Paenibacillus planticolens]|uniref:Adenylyl-sulfate kinase n=1 Tax=Paenibacillus planticolens TaxID=2654976 RepID=A0ABX1ZZZ9_9BACL|nr:adenylyl-sulfate kinase [Paenibacillus planticolens]NOV04597.1 adenylyl-sulfate kinase [Paenibacillus planticolens]
MSKHGEVLWFTGLSGSGKSTTARALVEPLRESGRKVELLDGDELRQTISHGLGFSREDRLTNIKRIVFLCKLLSRNGVTVIVSAITPYEEMREHARAELLGYVEIFVDCPLEECERRDVKGLYAKARNAEIKQFTGIGDPYEIPETPDIVIRTQMDEVENNVALIMDYMTTKTGRSEAV